MNILLPDNSPMLTPEFTYGVATASFQIEGAAHNRLPSIWDTFCNTPNKIRDGSNGEIACNHFHLWQQDIDLIDSLEVDAYRLSISWPRVMTLSGELNPSGVISSKGQAYRKDEFASIVVKNQADGTIIRSASSRRPAPMSRIRWAISAW